MSFLQYTFLCWLVLVAFLPSPGAFAQDPPAAGGICWMQYSMADNDLYAFLIADINEVQSSNFIREKNVTTWIYVDGNTKRVNQNQIFPTFYELQADGVNYGPATDPTFTDVRYLTWDHDLNALVVETTLPEANSDSPDALLNFLKRALLDCTARGRNQFILVMSSHGSGFEFGHDEDKAGGRRRRLQTRKLSQSNDDIAGAISSALAEYQTVDKLDVLAFDACLQASLSAMEDFKDVTRYYMASEALEPGTGYNYSAWKAEPTALAVARSNIDYFITTPSYRVKGVWHHQGPKTLGVFDMGVLPTFYQQWEALSAELSRLLLPQNDTTLFSTLTRSRAATAGFRTGEFDYGSGEPNEIFSFMDIGNFLEVFSRNCNPDIDTPLFAALNGSKVAYEDLVVQFGKGPLTPQPVTGVTIGWISRKRFLKDPVTYSEMMFSESSISRTAETPLYDAFLKQYLSYDKTKNVDGAGYSVCGCVNVAVPPEPDTLMWNQSVTLTSPGGDGGKETEKQVLISSSIAQSVDDVTVEFGLDITPIFIGEDGELLDDDDQTNDVSKRRAGRSLVSEKQNKKLLEALRKRFAKRRENGDFMPTKNMISSNRRRSTRRAGRKLAAQQRQQEQRHRNLEDAFQLGTYEDDYVLMFGGLLYPDYDCDSFTATWDKNFFTIVNATDEAVVDFLYVYRGSSGENSIDVIYFPPSVVTDEVQLEILTKMGSFELSSEDVEKAGGIWAELFFDNDQLEEWENRIPMDLLALYAPTPQGTYAQVSPAEGGYILPVMYLEAEFEGFIVLDYLIGGISSSIIEWGEEIPIDVGPVSAADVTSFLELESTIIDLVALEYESEGKEPKEQFAYYVLRHDKDGNIVQIEDAENTTSTEADADDDGSDGADGSGTREQPIEDGEEGEEAGNSTMGNNISAVVLAEPVNATTCAGAVCDEDEYCWNETQWGWKYDQWNTTQCIPKTYACGGLECENFPAWVCNLDRGACQSVADICEGVRTVEANCNDGTAWKRFTVPKDGIRTLKTREVCDYEPGKCGEPVPVEETEKSSGTKVAVFASLVFALISDVVASVVLNS